MQKDMAQDRPALRHNMPTGSIFYGIFSVNGK